MLRRWPTPAALQFILGKRLGWTASPTGSALTLGRKPRLSLAPDRQLASGWVDKMKTAAAGEAEDRLCNDPAGLADDVERGFEVADPDHRQRRRQRVRRISLQPDVGRTVGRRRIGRAIVGERPAERFRIERPRQFVRG